MNYPGKRVNEAAGGHPTSTPGSSWFLSSLEGRRGPRWHLPDFPYLCSDQLGLPAAQHR